MKDGGVGGNKWLLHTLEQLRWWHSSVCDVGKAVPQPGLSLIAPGLRVMAKERKEYTSFFRSLLTFSSDTTLCLRRTESSPVPAELLPDRSSENGTVGADGELQRPRHDCCIRQSCFSLTVSASLLRFHAEDPLDYSYLPKTLSNQFPLIETSINYSLESHNHFLK